MVFDYANSVTRKEAIEILCSNWKVQRETEWVSVYESIGRTASSDVTAKYDAPICRTSGLDGIAVSSKDFEKGIPDTSEWE